MALQHVRSSTANKRPVATNLADGQLGINYHVDSPGLFAKDSNNTLIKIGPIHVGTTAPNATPAGSAGNSKGEAWLDTSGTNALLKVWDGSAWKTVQPIASGTLVTTGDTGTVTSTMIADGTISNVDINNSAAIAHSKLASMTAGQVLLGNASNVPTSTAVTGDVTITSGGVTAIASGAIVDADVNASAAIAHSKLASMTAGRVLLGSASNVPTATAVTGDVTISSTGVTAIKSDVALTGTPTAPTATAGTNTTQIATTAFVSSAVDAARQGLTYKAGCRVATTGNITLSGTQTIDGVAVAAGERVLVKNQDTASQNGVYVVAAGAWTRATDFDATADLTDGAFIFVREGTLQADTGWVLSTDGVITVGTTSLVFVQFSGAGTYSAGTGLQLNGTQFSLAALPSANLLIGNSSNVATATAVTGDVTISNTGVTAIGASKVTNAMLAGSIADSKLSTISTAGKVANSATTATNLNTASAIVARDASGNFSAGTITAALSGNASTATTLQNARNINGVSFNGSADITVTANTGSSLTFNNAGSGGASGSTFNGGSALTVSYNTIGAAGATGQNASGTNWGISITGSAASCTGNAATATKLSSTRTFALTGDVTGTVNSDLTSGASITTAIAAGSIVNADVNASAAIAGTKISPDFGSQAVSTTGSLTAGSGVIDGGGLRITNTGSGHSLLVEDEANPDSTPFFIDAAGRVINGHTASIGTVNIGGNAVGPQFQQHAADQGGATIASTNWQNSSTGAYLTLSKSYGGAIGTHAPVVANATIGFVNFTASDGVSAFGSAAWIGAYADALTAAGSTPGRLLFATSSPGATSPTERMRIRSDGNIGIGGSGNTNVSVFNQKPITGSTTAYAWATTTSVQSDVTGNAYGYYSGLSTAASTFRLGSLNHFYAAQGALGAGSAVTAQFGFRVDSSLDDADDNYAFHSALSSANCWNFFAAGSAPNYLAGDLRIGSTTDTGDKLFVNGTSRFANDLLLQDATATIRNTNTDAYVVVSGGSAGGTGGNIVMYGESHATNPDEIRIRQDGTSRLVISTNGSISLTAGGTNQNITLTPSGTGTVNAPTFNATSTTNGGFQGIATDSATLPSFTWTGDTDTGMFRPDINTLALSTGGAERLRVHSSGNVSIGATTDSGNRLYVNGSVSINSTLTTGSTITINNAAALIASGVGTGYTGISGDTVSSVGANLLLYGASHATLANRILLRQNTSTIALVHGDTGNISIASNTDTGDKVYINGTLRTANRISSYLTDLDTAPGFTWAGNENTGMFRATTDSVGISAGGSEVFRTDLSGSTYPRRIHFESSAQITNAGGSMLIDASGTGTGVLYLEAGASVRSVLVYNTTTATAANMTVGSTGILYRSTSSIKYKHVIEAADLSFSENLIYNSEPVWYRSLCDADPESWSYWGFIAEEVAQLDPRMVHWGGENNDEPEGVQYDRYVVHLVNVIQKQKQQLDAIETRLAALEAA